MALTINTMNSTGLTGLFGGTGAQQAGFSLSDYASLKNGSYGKLIKSYYAQGLDKDGDVVSKTASKASKELSRIKTDGANLKDAAEAFLKNGKDGLFTQTETKNEDGTVTKSYDKDKIYKAIKSFADSYNDMITSGGESDDTAILTQTASLVKNTSTNAKLLGAVGVSIGKDNKLSVDEDYFKKNANMDQVKSLFSGRGSYIDQQASKASAIETYTKNQLSAKSGYTNSGNYSLSAADMISTFTTKS